MEAFELLMEAEDFNDAANLLIGANVLLARWGFSQYLEGQYRRLFDRLDVRQTAAVFHNFGSLIADRGDYDKALEYYNQSLKISGELGDRAGTAYSLGQIGIIYRNRGEYNKALENYEQVLGISEELGDRSSIAIAFHEIGKLFVDVGRYDEAFKNLLSALSMFIELQSPTARNTVNDLKKLRAKWGEENFDATWKEAMGGDMPDELKE